MVKVLKRERSTWRKVGPNGTLGCAGPTGARGGGTRAAGLKKRSIALEPRGSPIGVGRSGRVRFCGTVRVVKPTREGVWRRFGVGYTATVDVADVTDVREQPVKWTSTADRVRCASYWSEGVVRQGLVDVVDRFRQMLANIADIADGEDVGSELLLDLQTVLLDHGVLELRRFRDEGETGDGRQVSDLGCCRGRRRNNSLAQVRVRTQGCAAPVLAFG